MRTRLHTVFGAVLLGILSLGFVSCEEEPVIPDPDFVLVRDAVSSRKGSQFLEVYAQGKWTITCDADWIRITPDKGRGNNRAIALQYDANTEEGPRQADIRLQAQEKTLTVTLHQNAPSDDPEPEINGGSSTRKGWMELPETRSDDGLNIFWHTMTVGNYTGRNYSSPSGIPAGSVYAQGGSNTPPFKLEYPAGLQKSIDRRFSANLRLVCNIPRMKMVISASNQVVFYSYRHTTNQKSDPFAWIDTDLSYHEITQAMLDDPETRIKGILLSAQRRNPADSQPVTQPAIWLMNMRLTKDVSKNFGFSFFVNNAFYYMPYQSSSYSGTLTERNTGTFSFGVEMYVKI